MREKIRIFIFPFGVLITGIIIVFFISRFGIVSFPFFPKKEVSLKYWGLWEPENTLRPLIDEYQKKHPGVTIFYLRQSPKEYRERLQAAIGRNEGPDIFRFHNTWVPMLKNELTPVPSTIMDKAFLEKTFYPVASNGWGIPLGIDGLLLFYNEEILKSAGVSVPKTWEEFKEASIKLTVKDALGKIQLSGAALGTFNNIEHASDIIGLMMLQNGVEMTKIDKTIAVNGDNLGEDALAFYTSFSVNPLEKTWDETMENSIRAFAGGKAAIIFAPSWQTFEIKNLNPQLPFKVASVPRLPGTKIGWATFWLEGVSQKSKHQAQAFDFLKFLSSKESLIKLYNETSKTRLFGEPYSRTDLADSLKNDTFAGEVIKQAPYFRSWYLASRTFDNGINDRIIKYFEDAVNSINKGTSVATALEIAAKGTDQVLNTYGIGAAVTPEKKK